MAIHTIGDSHSYSGWTGVISHHIDSLLCYTFGKEKLNRCDIRNYNMNDGDTIIFCLGEIDCRCHIFKHINSTTTYKNIIDDIVDNYFETIKLNIVTSQINFKNICVYNVVPPVQKFNTIENKLYPYLGSDEERRSFVLYFNIKLKQKCIENNYIFFDIYENYADKNGFLKKDLSDGDVHIKNGKYISRFIIKKKI